VKDDRCGLLVDSVEPSVLGPCLARALRGEWNREAIAEHGRSFSWDAAAEAVERTLRTMGEGQA
jgi:hypothetical protein